MAVPHFPQKAVPSLNGVPQFLQKPAILPPENFHDRSLKELLCQRIVPETRGSGKRQLDADCTAALQFPPRLGFDKRELVNQM